MPENKEYDKEIYNRYGGSYFNDRAQAEAYKAHVKEKTGKDYEIVERNGQFLVDHPKKGHPYWRQARKARGE